MIIRVRPMALAQIVNDYENDLYGKDFSAELSRFAHWLDSPAYFWSCATNSPDEEAVGSIVGVLSILATTEDSARDMIFGGASECDLVPWARSSEGQPVLYYSSYSANEPGAGRKMFRASREYFVGSPLLADIHPAYAFAIAATREGEAHLERAGFVSQIASYRGRYPILSGNCTTFRIAIWKELMNCESSGAVVRSDVYTAA